MRGSERSGGQEMGRSDAQKLLWRHFRPQFHHCYRRHTRISNMGMSEISNHTTNYIQGSVKRQSPGLVNFVPAVAHHFCLALPAAFTQPWAHLLAL